MTTRYQIFKPKGIWDSQNRVLIMPNASDPNWQEYQSWLTAGNSPLQADSVGTDDLVNAKAKRVLEIDAYAAGLRNIAVRGRSSAEMATWTLKLLDAMARASSQASPFASVLSSIGTTLGLPEAPVSYNDAIAKVRGITEASHVNKVLTQAVPFLVIEAAIDGTRGKHCDAVNASTTVEEIVLYDWHTGWPALP